MQIREFLTKYNQRQVKLGVNPVSKQSVNNWIWTYQRDKDAGVPEHSRRGLKAYDVRTPNAKRATWVIDDQAAKEFLKTNLK